MIRAAVAVALVAAGVAASSWAVGRLPADVSTARYLAVAWAALLVFAAAAVAVLAWS